MHAIENSCTSVFSATMSKVGSPIRLQVGSLVAPVPNSGLRYPQSRSPGAVETSSDIGSIKPAQKHVHNALSTKIPPAGERLRGWDGRARSGAKVAQLSSCSALGNLQGRASRLIDAKDYVQHPKGGSIFGVRNTAEAAVAKMPACTRKRQTTLAGRPFFSPAHLVDEACRQGRTEFMCPMVQRNAACFSAENENELRVASYRAYEGRSPSPGCVSRSIIASKVSIQNSQDFCRRFACGICTRPHGFLQDSSARMGRSAHFNPRAYWFRLELWHEMRVSSAGSLGGVRLGASRASRELVDRNSTGMVGKTRVPFGFG